MTEILFYHLEQQPLEQVLPLLLEKSLQKGWRAVVETAAQKDLEPLDRALWTYSAQSFLPHEIRDGETAAPASGTTPGPETARETEAPIVLCCGTANPNHAHIRFFVRGAQPVQPVHDGEMRESGQKGNGQAEREQGATAYQRLVYLFDGHDPEQVNTARSAWKALCRDHQTTYWQQQPDGRWQKKG
ncbi:MAG TPA: DNA polymerase III subunit chi [Devosia sp.]|nr:DNA polymerase III subunit chi [Devosia sp.]